MLFKFGYHFFGNYNIGESIKFDLYEQKQAAELISLFLLAVILEELLHFKRHFLDSGAALLNIAHDGAFFVVRRPWTGLVDRKRGIIFVEGELADDILEVGIVGTAIRV